ncbi:Nicotinate-nucleotide adenylyltransferase [Leifsonia rubra CMS 76R]|nr:Nicotinate-nucleotide adenylyltransferase [Leifsonia rubra CMS 76R]
MSAETAPRRSRIGIMGGTFDPIHNGHLVAASEAQVQFELDEVIFVPTGKPWMKSTVTAGEHRYLMTVIATAANPGFNVSRVDLEREGATYTIDTLRDMRKAYPDADLFFITGADAMTQIMEWKDVSEVWDLAHFIAVSRPGHPLTISGLPTQGVSSLEVPALAISSTDCRTRVSQGSPVWYLVPDGVVQYIAKHHLYRSMP